MKKIGAILLIVILLACTLIGSFFYAAYKFWNPSWTTEATLEGPDGYTYYFMNYSMLQAQQMKLVREKSGISEEIGSNNGDWPRSWASIIRPKGASDDDYGQLYVSSDNVILGIRYANNCYYAYDIDENVFYGHGEIEKISPFLLIEKQTELHDADIYATILRVAERADGFSLPGCPNDEVLQASLNHPNEKVRVIAKWLLEIRTVGLNTSNDTIHEMMDYILLGLESENMTVRLNAIKVCGYFQVPEVEKAIPVLEETVYKKHARLASDAAISLGRLGEKSWPVLLKFLKSEDKSIRFYGLLGFRFAGPKARDYEQEIQLLLNDRNADVRKQAILALEEIRKDD